MSSGRSSEFDLIRRYFSGIGGQRSDVIIGVGDDCALLRIPAGNELAVSIDTLVSDVHFLPATDPFALGHKCLAAGLSDLASMGAEPAWATLALTLQITEHAWLEAFARGFSRLAESQGVTLIGGDTTSGPLSITVQVHGLIPAGQAIKRSGAQPGDLILVSGILGDAGLALRRLKAREPLSRELRNRLQRPEPRVALGRDLRGIATAMIDISDGLAADLGHILEASGVGAEIELSRLPLSQPVAEQVVASGDWALPLSSGDDYELCFTLPAERRGELAEIGRRCACPLRIIGRVTAGAGLACLLPNGELLQLRRAGYDHFGG